MANGTLQNAKLTQFYYSNDLVQMILSETNVRWKRDNVKAAALIHLSKLSFAEGIQAFLNQHETM